MCFMWIPEQTAIISLYSINWLDVITEIECVYCAVRAGSLNGFRLHTKPLVTRSFVFQVLGFGWCDAPVAAAPATATTRLQ